jgi:hypothetical protein
MVLQIISPNSGVKMPRQKRETMNLESVALISTQNDFTRSIVETQSVHIPHPDSLTSLSWFLYFKLVCLEHHIKRFIFKSIDYEQMIS